MTNPQLQRVISEETLLEMLGTLNGRQLLVLHVLMGSENCHHAAEQLGVTYQAVCYQVYAMRKALTENIAGLAADVADRNPMAGRAKRRQA